MADGVLETQDEGRAETQADYDRAVADYVEWLNTLTPQAREAHWKKVEWIKRWEPDVARCPTCGEAAQELKWSREHTEWRCMEPTCGNRWEWRKR